MIEEEITVYYRCQNCGYEWKKHGLPSELNKNFPFCPNCMKKEIEWEKEKGL